VRIVYSPRALRDIDEAVDYVAADNPLAARRLLDHLDDVIDRLAAGELSGPQVRLRSGGAAASLVTAALPHLLSSHSHYFHSLAAPPPGAPLDRGVLAPMIGAAIANAVRDATGVPVHELPICPTAIHPGLRAAPLAP